MMVSARDTSEDVPDHDFRLVTTLAEGAFTAPVLADLARARDVDMPITFAVDAILKGETSVGAAITALLARPSRSE